jgi:hypothetical protein
VVVEAVEVVLPRRPIERPGRRLFSRKTIPSL